MKDNVILNTVSRIFIVPQTLLFGFYVIAHGEGGPGGGFQGGVIIAAGIIFYSIIFGLDETEQLVSRAVLETLASFGVLLYAAVGVICMWYGGKFLQYNVLPFHHKHVAAEMGILGVEIGIGITVASAITLIYLELSDNRGD